MEVEAGDQPPQITHSEVEWAVVERSVQLAVPSAAALLLVALERLLVALRLAKPTLLVEALAEALWGATPSAVLEAHSAVALALVSEPQLLVEPSAAEHLPSALPPLPLPLVVAAEWAAAHSASPRNRLREVALAAVSAELLPPRPSAQPRPVARSAAEEARWAVWVALEAPSRTSRVAPEIPLSVHTL